MSERIFISYRREDSSGYTGRLFDRLSEAFGRDRVFMDIEAIEPGSDFVESIDQAVGGCGVLLAVIGPRWVSAADPDGRRRLDDPNDFIRLEVASALSRGVRVVPVLVNGAVMPREEDLPEDLRGFARRQALELSDSRWDYDVGRLSELLKRQLDAGHEAPGRPDEPVRQPGHAPHPEAETGGAASPARRPSMPTYVTLAVGAVVIVGYLVLTERRPPTEPEPPLRTAPTAEGAAPVERPMMAAPPPAEQRAEEAAAAARLEAEKDAAAARRAAEEEAERARREEEAAAEEVRARTERQVAGLLEAGAADLAADRLMRPSGENAYERFKAVLEIAPGHPQAMDGLRRVVLRYMELARTSVRSRRFDQGLAYLDRAHGVAEEYPELAALRPDIMELAAAARERQRVAEREVSSRARERLAACAAECEASAARCKERARDTASLERCRSSARRGCEQVYEECRSSNQALIFGEVSAESECGGRQAACERERFARCDKIAGKTEEGCDQEWAACREGCGP